MSRVAFGTLTLKAHSLSAGDSQTGCSHYGSALLLGLPSCTLLDRRHEQGVEAFCANWVTEICRNVNPGVWKHCPGKSNPADLPSRGLSVLELSVNQLWRQGPEWLLTGSEHFEEPQSTVMPEKCVQELKSSTKVSHSMLTVERPATVAEVINCEDFSDLQRLL